ncbi:uncharacterized protein BJ171DRAFT_28351 [Polychytrium aggregatum]|uniref:uncharacterized protein n=1 Tax=Polychytrium aggregatum TaxID=110093 RepID=UPI0022FED142|nr:uncharacterized protein BJ171DRAFT_28351 [Polychytrium aggregatum]KAI9206327.1 hypothetical protein BJ171DRAFT_28351 [Polychytrium aggregatum]
MHAQYHAQYHTQYHVRPVAAAVREAVERHAAHIIEERDSLQEELLTLRRSYQTALVRISQLEGKYMTIHSQAEAFDDVADDDAPRQRRGYQCRQCHGQQTPQISPDETRTTNDSGSDDKPRGAESANEPSNDEPLAGRWNPLLRSLAKAWKDTPWITLDAVLSSHSGLLQGLDSALADTDADGLQQAPRARSPAGTSRSAIPTPNTRQRLSSPIPPRPLAASTPTSPELSSMPTPRRMPPTPSERRQSVIVIDTDKEDSDAGDREANDTDDSHRRGEHGHDPNGGGHGDRRGSQDDMALFFQPEAGGRSKSRILSPQHRAPRSRDPSSSPELEGTPASQSSRAIRSSMLDYIEDLFPFPIKPRQIVADKSRSEDVPAQVELDESISDDQDESSNAHQGESKVKSALNDQGKDADIHCNDDGDDEELNDDVVLAFETPARPKRPQRLQQPAQESAMLETPISNVRPPRILVKETPLARGRAGPGLGKSKLPLVESTVSVDLTRRPISMLKKHHDHQTTKGALKRPNSRLEEYSVMEEQGAENMTSAAAQTRSPEWLGDDMEPLPSPSLSTRKMLKRAKSDSILEAKAPESGPRPNPNHVLLTNDENGRREPSVRKTESGARNDAGSKDGGGSKDGQASSTTGRIKSDKPASAAAVTSAKEDERVEGWRRPDVAYKYKQVFRKKEDRSCLHGTDCHNCHLYFKEVGHDKQQLNKVSRHKYLYQPPPTSPPG